MIVFTFMCILLLFANWVLLGLVRHLKSDDMYNYGNILMTHILSSFVKDRIT